MYTIVYATRSSTKVATNVRCNHLHTKQQHATLAKTMKTNSQNDVSLLQRVSLFHAYD